MNKNMSEVLIIGGGAAGMLAAIGAAQKGHHVVLVEKNEKLGKKIYITGKGRCNVTNAGDFENIMQNIVTNSRFLYSSLYSFTNQDMMDLLENAGLPLKTERGNRVFPLSDKSSDVIQTLARLLKKYQVKVHLQTKAAQILLEDLPQEVEAMDDNENVYSKGKKSKKAKKIKQTYCCKGIETEDGQKYLADCVIVATGGISYPLTGSTGDGYQLAKACGHAVTTLYPALVPMTVGEDWIGELQGLSLKNVQVSITKDKKKIYDSFGEMLFTHFGVSGPAVLSGSSLCTKYLDTDVLTLHIDLKPALSEKQLDERILRDFEEAKNKQLRNALNHLYPSKLIPVIISRSQISPEKKIHDISKEERERLVSLTKDFTLTLTGTRDFKEAIITQGGISVKEINPATMESKLVKNLRFAGEVLDVDAFTGGYNLQIAWSTGWTAGNTIEEI